MKKFTKTVTHSFSSSFLPKMEYATNTNIALRNDERLGCIPSNDAPVMCEGEVLFEQLYYNCPICLGAFEVIHSDLEEGIYDPSDRSEFSSRVPIHRDDCYQLESCRHILCRSCLILYCKSNISNGVVNIPCCYPVETTDTSERNNENRTHDRETLEQSINSFSTFTTWIKDGVLTQTDTGDTGDDHNNHTNNTDTNNEHSDPLILCGAIFTDQDVEQIIITSKNTAGAERKQQLDLYSRYKRFQYDYLHGDASRRCPKCDTARIFQFYNADASPITFSLSQTDVEQQQQTQQHTSNVSGASPQPKAQSTKQNPITPIVHCLECQTEFCYFHSNAHPGRTCEEYENELQEDRESAEYLRSHCKQCPKCGINIQKIDGCDHVQCLMCQTNFNWSSLSVTYVHPLIDRHDNFSFIRSIHRMYDMYFGNAGLIRRVLQLPFVIIFILPRAFIITCLIFPYYRNNNRFNSCFARWWTLSWLTLFVAFYFLPLWISFIKPLV